MIKIILYSCLLMLAFPLAGMAQSENGIGEEETCEFFYDIQNTTVETDFDASSNNICTTTKEVETRDFYEGPCNTDPDTWTFARSEEIILSEETDCVKGNSSDQYTSVCEQSAMNSYDVCFGAASATYGAAIIACVASGPGYAACMIGITAAYEIATLACYQSLRDDYWTCDNS